MTQKPKGTKGLRRKLQREKQTAAIEIKRALLEAGKAIDEQTAELITLRRILISERAQVIYYSEKYEKFCKQQCLDLAAVSFLDIPEAEQEAFIKRAVVELSVDKVTVQ